MKINHELKNIIKFILLEDKTPGNSPPDKQVHVFDFDDTLGITNNPNGVMPYLNGKPLLNSEEDAKRWLQQNGLTNDLLEPKSGPAIKNIPERGGYAVYLSSAGLAKIQTKVPRNQQKVTGYSEPDKQGEFLLIDFTPSSFVDQKTTKPIKQTIDKLKKVNAAGGKTAVMTARKGEGTGINFSGESIPNTNTSDIDKFLSTMGATPNAGVMGVSGQNKGNAIKSKFDSMKPEEIHFYDDLSKNTSEVDAALSGDKDKEVYIYGPGEFAHGQADANKPTKSKPSEKINKGENKMENIFENWRKYIKKTINEQTDAAVQSAEEELKNAQDANKKTAAYAETMKKQAAMKQQSAQNNLNTLKQQAAAANKMKTNNVAKSGISSTTPTTTLALAEENVEEVVGFDGTQEGSMGPDQTPVSVYEEQTSEIYEGYTDEGTMCELEYEDIEEVQRCGSCESCMQENQLNEGEYQGRKVKLGKKMKGDVKKYKVYVRNDKGNIVKVNFGDKKMRIKKSNPARRKSFRARHNCSNPGPRWKARYWSCKNW